MFVLYLLLAAVLSVVAVFPIGNLTLFATVGSCFAPTTNLEWGGSIFGFQVAQGAHWHAV
jgi:hypothetical protein